MSTDNTTLEEMVEKTLESTGVLPKMRAELRANVFGVLEKGSSFQNKLYTDKIKDFVFNKNGLLLLSLVKDLFEYLELTYTSSVFDPETGAGLQYQYKNKNDICQELSLSKDDKRPLLLQILETYQPHFKTKSGDNPTKSYPLQYNGESHEGSSVSQILENNIEPTKTILDNESKSLSPIKSNVLEPRTFVESNINSGSLSSSNFNLSDNIELKNADSFESLNSLSIDQLSPNKRSIDQNDNTDEDVKSDLKSNKNESSLEDVETDENVSCGNDSLASTDLSTRNSSPEMIKTRNIHL